MSPGDATGAEEDFAKRLLMREHVDLDAAHELSRALRESVSHNIHEPTPVARLLVEEEVPPRGKAPPRRASGWAVLTQALSHLTPAERDAWLSSVILSSVADGIAHVRKHDTVTASDVQEAKGVLCDRWPKCSKMRVDSAVHSAVVLALNRDKILSVG